MAKLFRFPTTVVAPPNELGINQSQFGLALDSDIVTADIQIHQQIDVSILIMNL